MSKKTKKAMSMLLVVALIAVIAVGGMLAYLTSEDSDVNVMALGNVEIEQIEEQRVDTTKGGTLTAADIEPFDQNKPLLPYVDENLNGAMRDDYEEVTFPNGKTNKLFINDNAVDKMVAVKNTGKSDAYVRTIVALEAPTDKIDLSFNSTDWTMDKTASSNSITVDGVDYDLFVAYYKGSLAPNAVTPYSLLQILLDGTATNEDAAQYGDTYDVLVLSQAVQTAGFADATTALNAGFGEVNKENATEWFTGIPVGFEVSNDAEFAAAVAAGETEIWLNPGEYDLRGAGGKNLIINGTKEAIITPLNEGEDGCDYAFDGSDVTFNGITIDTSKNTGNYKGFARLAATFNGCDIKGAYTTHRIQTFNNCNFNTNDGYIWIWGAEKVNFNACTFGGNSKTILAHGWASSEVNIKDCDFIATEKGYTGAGDNTAAVEIDPAGTNTYTINFSGNNTKNENYAGWTRIKDGSTSHIITGLN